ncbi:MAG: hypothetical protein KatS3mg095_0067 [Candidatus Parcubacteria bacterium]|nr:MAG: hypothetical protein KatS3mg095_0067 [Candidatus Parcubacteria bacterium]
MYKINLNKDKILIIAQEIKKIEPSLNFKISLINNKITIKSKEKISLDIKKQIELIIKIHIPDCILNFEATN